MKKIMGELTKFGRVKIYPKIGGNQCRYIPMTVIIDKKLLQNSDMQRARIVVSSSEELKQLIFQIMDTYTLATGKQILANELTTWEIDCDDITFQTSSYAIKSGIKPVKPDEPDIETSSISSNSTIPTDYYNSE